MSACLRLVLFICVRLLAFFLRLFACVCLHLSVFVGSFVSLLPFFFAYSSVRVSVCARLSVFVCVTPFFFALVRFAFLSVVFFSVRSCLTVSVSVCVCLFTFGCLR